MVDRVDAFQRRNPIVGYPIAVVYKFFDDQGAYLAALITYYGFLSIFPLLLLFTSILGFIMESNPGLRAQILRSTLAQIPVIGPELQAPKGLEGSTPVVITGALLALYGGIGVAQAIQNMSNTCWNVPRNHRPNPILARFRSAGIMVFIGCALAFIGWLPSKWAFLDGWWGLLLNVCIGTGLFQLLMKMTTAREQGWTRLIPGAIFVSVVWQGFLRLAPVFVDTFLARSSATYGTLGTGLSLLIAGYILAIALVLGTEMNVVLRRGLYPRALLTPFTDAVDLTLADQRAYSALAHTQRLKGYEYIDVVFDKDGDGVADAPSDLARRWDDVRSDYERLIERGHPRRPARMWRLNDDRLNDEADDQRDEVGTDDGHEPAGASPGPATDEQHRRGSRRVEPAAEHTQRSEEDFDEFGETRPVPERDRSDDVTCDWRRR